MPAISVIVPVYKVEAFLRPCVDSILAQTFQDFELILVDDGSPDNCGAICDEYSAKDSCIRVIHQENGGLSAARNTGIDAARGEYLTFIDSDDYVREDYLARLLQIISSNGAEISVCGMCEFREDGPIPSRKEGDGSCTVVSGREAVLLQYSDASPIRVSACCKLYHRNLFSEIRFPVGKLHEDQAVTPIVLFNAAKVAAISDPLYCYRHRGQSIMHSKFSLRRYDDVTGAQQCAAYFEQKGDVELAAAARHRHKELICIYALLARKSGAYHEVPQQYRISTHQALKWMRDNLPDRKYVYHLAKYDPKRIRMHEYWRKIKKTLHIPCQ